MTLAKTLALLSPELVLLAGGLGILLLDMIWKDDEGKKDWLPYLTLVGLGGALAAVIVVWRGLGGGVSALATMLDVDALAMFICLMAVLVAALVVVFSVEFVRGKTPYRGEFYAFLLFAALGIALMAAATNLVLIYISVELLSVTSYVLTGYLRGDAKSNEAAIKYFLYGAIVSAAMLYGMSLFYGITGTTDLRGIAEFFSDPASMSELHWVVFAAMVLLFAGLGFKIAAVPFHQWAPDAYEGAPTPVTAFLSVGPKAAGFAVLLRVLIIGLPQFEADWTALLAAISIVTMTLGNVVAIVQKNIKRMIAYSSIAQAGYILIGLACLGADNYGLQGVLLYLLVYLFANLGLFAVVIAFSNATGSDEIEDYAGLMRRSPWLAAGMVVFFLSLVGIPPTAGFFGKVLIFASAIRTQSYLLAAIGVLNGVISLYYYFNVVRQGFFLPPKEAAPIPAAPELRVALLVCMAVVLGIGVFPQPFIQLAQGVARLLAI
ncbi:MAG: NADH-quinone oxidoreductase subunit N [Anaerolineae bacterium]|nr:NADH-quinone oxidoreductase subunit N [Anaerolineae bacterium]